MRGQAQALFQFLVGSVAGITGAFFCSWLYRVQITEALDSWTAYWLVLALLALAPLFYFIAGVVRKDAR